MAVETPKHAPATRAGNTPRRDSDDTRLNDSTRQSETPEVKRESAVAKTRNPENDGAKTAVHSRPAAKPAFKPGIVLNDRYEILALLGSGGTSRVFKARDRHMEKAGESASQVAIKILNERYTGDEEAERLLQQEVYKSRRLSHPNLVRIYDCDKADGQFFVVMELLDGEPLDAVIKRARPRGLPPKGVINILRDLGGALEAAHGAGLIHADLKPSNIMVTHDGKVKLLDFGVARPIRRPALPGLEGKSEADEVLGLTPAYASCALLEGEAPTPTDDLFALACIGYEMLTTQHPFNRKPANEARAANMVAKRCGGLSGAQWRALKKALAFDRRNGFSDVPAFMKAFDQRRHWARWAAVAALLVAIAASAGWGYLQHRQVAKWSQQDDAHRALVDRLAKEFSQQAQDGKQLLSGDALQQLSTVEKAGLLRLQHDDFVNHLKQEVANGLSKPDGQYVDFVGLQSLLTQAKQLYPDSQALAVTQQELNQRRSGLLSALTFQANGLLEQQRYEHAKGDDDLYQVAAHLQSIQPGYQMPTSDRAVDAYDSAVAKAVDAWDPARLQTLLDIGRLYFPQQPAYLKLTQRGDDFIAAVKSMASYEKAAADGKAALPEKAAQTFYGGYLDHLSDALEKSNDENTLQQVESGLGRVAKQLPASFQPLVNVRRKLANAYIRSANQLLDQGHYRRGKAFISRANHILSSLGG